jgi:hypothetical protein
MKKIIISVLSLIPFTLFIPTAQAGRLEPTHAACWLFRGEKVELKNRCKIEGWSWAGGGFSDLTWEDGVKTKLAFGLQGRGERVCPDNEMAVDGICGRVYFRGLRTLQPISEREGQRLRMDRKAITCVQLKQKSVCWIY